MKNWIFLCFIFCSLTACSDDTDCCVLCPKSVELDESRFQDRDSEETGIVIQNISIDGDCLFLEVGYSGCNGGHEIDLIFDGSVAESLPPQVGVALIDTQVQACEAFFMEEISFDLSPFKEWLKNEESVLIRFPDQNESILYEF